MTETAYIKKTLYILIFAVTILLLHNNRIDSELHETADLSEFPGELPQGYLNADIKLGALLYDNWLKVRDVRISTNHPLYPSKTKRNGSTTWRCKECHGWDYLGENGSYGAGLHFTGIKGLYDSRNQTPEELFSAITNTVDAHDFTENLHLSVTDIWALVKFIREGIIDVREMISVIGIANGSISEGKYLYAQYCSECHGMDGRKINFREDLEGTHGVGWEALADPHETLHKIRWGHPGTDKPSMVADKKLSDEDIVDILSFSQTLYP